MEVWSWSIMGWVGLAGSWRWGDGRGDYNSPCSRFFPSACFTAASWFVFVRGRGSVFVVGVWGGVGGGLE